MSENPTESSDAYTRERGRTIASLTVILGTLALSWSFTTVLNLALTKGPPLPPTNAGEDLSSLVTGLSSVEPYLYVLALLSVLTGFGYALFRLMRDVPRLVSLLSGAAFFALSLGTSLFYLSVLSLIGFQIPELSAQLIALAAAIILTLSMIIGRPKASLISGPIVGSGAGVMLGFSLETSIGLILLSSIVIFDYVMVRYGYLSKLRDSSYLSNLRSLRGLIIDGGDFVLGLGDVILYSFLISLVYFSIGAFSALLSSIGIVTGFLLTLATLRRRGIAPAASLPLLIGLIGGTIPLFI
ncbi:MAG: hypothetical protein NZ920_03410 [Aigarchaeota archaeon]|nr:hypothetical protein [Aigarchaeota archaeon]MDW8092333.1 hypothetical protein [Nitrososphaerota archaeon]